MTDLVAFLRARLDEDEAAAQSATSGPWLAADGEVQAENGNLFLAEVFFPGDVGHIARHDPARVLREVGAKRRIVDDHAPDFDFYCQADSTCKDPNDPDLREQMPCRYMRWLAAPYDDHPDYRSEWKP